MKTPVVIFGCGGHARVVADLLSLLAEYELVAAYDDESSCYGRPVSTIYVKGGRDELLEYAKSQPDVRVALGIGSNRCRQAITEWCDVVGLSLATGVHPAATISKSARLGEGTIICAGAVVNPEAHLGRGVIVNTCASIDHDCRVADFVHCSPGARICGGVTLDEGVWVGAGAVVVPSLTAGAWSTVGAGAVVVKDVLPAVTVVGVPAEPLEGNL